jgi:large subunit ribosomal protein L15
MQINELKRKNPNAKSISIGRGGKRGKTSGRGTKGQKAHGGHGMRPEMRDIIKRIPKLRGHGKNRSRTVNPNRATPVTLNLAFLEKTFEKGAKVTPMILVEQNMIRVRGNKMSGVKILGVGELTKALVFEGCLVSAAAKVKIEQAGGSVA